VLPQAEAREGARNVCFQWHPLEAAMSICYCGLFFVKTVFFYYFGIKKKGRETAINAESQAF